MKKTLKNPNFLNKFSSKELSGKHQKIVFGGSQTEAYEANKPLGGKIKTTSENTGSVL